MIFITGKANGNFQATFSFHMGTVNALKCVEK